VDFPPVGLLQKRFFSETMGSTNIFRTIGEKAACATMAAKADLTQWVRDPRETESVGYVHLQRLILGNFLTRL
jgi:hypothetical protein